MTGGLSTALLLAAREAPGRSKDAGLGADVIIIIVIALLLIAAIATFMVRQRGKI